jgi:hypothetical protein
MAKVSGLSLKIFPLFIKENFGEEGYEKWKNALGGELKQVFDHSLIGLDNWYDFEEFYIKPMQAVNDLLYGGDEKSAWEMGRFSAEYALKGVLKVFVRIGTTHFLMKRVTAITSKYYKPMDMRLINSGKNSATLAIIDFPEYHILLENRICGWIERALEISACSNIKIDIIKPFDKEERTVEIKFQWQ